MTKNYRATGEHHYDDNFVVCPICHHEHADAWEMANESKTEATCRSCGYEFICWAEYSVTYHSQSIEDGNEEEVDD